MKKRKKKTLDKELDDLWAELVKAKAGYKCEFEGCNNEAWKNAKGKRVGLQAHHFYSRSNYPLRWDLENGFCLCPGHHTLSINSAHKAPADFCEWAVEYRGQDWIDGLREKKNGLLKLMRHEKKELIEQYRQRIKEL